jgi:hypothetical protein
MITILFALVSLLSFRARSRASLELELVALRHLVTILRRQRHGQLRLFSGSSGPSAGAMLIEASGTNATICVLTVLALINVVLIGVLWTMCRPQISTEA